MCWVWANAAAAVMQKRASAGHACAMGHETLVRLVAKRHHVVAILARPASVSRQQSALFLLLHGIHEQRVARVKRRKRVKVTVEFF